MHLNGAVFASFVGFHGSDQRFDSLNGDLDAYEDDGLCVSASALVAARYGRFIYCIECNAVRVLPISLRNWRQTSDQAVEQLKVAQLDGFWLQRLPNAEDATFHADTLIVWSIGKCSIRSRLEHSLDINPDGFGISPTHSRQVRLGFTPFRIPREGPKLAPQVYKLTSRAKRLLSQERITVRCDVSRSPGAWIQSILEQSRDRSGGKVEQHLVGAKLEERHQGIAIPNYAANAGDQQTGRKGDFLVGTTAYHVTTAPGRDVVSRCAVNLTEGIHPVLLVPKGQVSRAHVHADEEKIGERITIIAIEDFLALNIIEMTAGDQQAFRAKLAAIVERYNRRLREVETDPSLSIELA